MQLFDYIWLIRSKVNDPVIYADLWVLQAVNNLDDISITMACVSTPPRFNQTYRLLFYVILRYRDSCMIAYNDFWRMLI